MLYSPERYSNIKKNIRASKSARDEEQKIANLSYGSFSSDPDDMNVSEEVIEKGENARN